MKRSKAILRAIALGAADGVSYSTWPFGWQISRGRMHKDGDRSASGGTAEPHNGSWMIWDGPVSLLKPHSLGIVVFRRERKRKAKNEI